MANDIPTVLSSLTFEGADLQRSDLALHLEVVRGFLETAQVRGTDTVVPGRTGRIPRNRVKDIREIELAGWVLVPGSTEAARLAAFQSVADELQTIFDPTQDPGDLEGEDWNGATRTITARPLPPIVWAPAPVPGVYRLSVVLISTDPDWSGAGS